MADLSQLLERAGEVKLKGGLVGRVCGALVVACVCLGAIGVATSNVWVSAVAVGGIIVLAFPILWRVISFAEKNPGAAILDGAHFVQHERLLQASKSQPSIVVSAQADAREIDLSADLPEVNKPDAASTLPEKPKS